MKLVTLSVRVTLLPMEWAERVVSWIMVMADYQLVRVTINSTHNTINLKCAHNYELRPTSVICNLTV